MGNPLIQRCGEALYGPRWQTELARDLGVNDRTVRRWISGACIPPPGVKGDLLRLLEARAHEIDKILEAEMPREGVEAPA